MTRTELRHRRQRLTHERPYSPLTTVHVFLMAGTAVCGYCIAAALYRILASRNTRHAPRACHPRAAVDKSATSQCRWIMTLSPHALITSKSQTWEAGFVSRFVSGTKIRNRMCVDFYWDFPSFQPISIESKGESCWTSLGIRKPLRSPSRDRDAKKEGCGDATGSERITLGADRHRSLF